MKDMNIKIIGESPALQGVIRAAGLVASADVTTLICGERGTGKELLARLLHSKSQRSTNTFVALNCAALPEPLAEATLFGHRKGAYTGAADSQPGVIKAADGGTLFLDEIGELPLSLQAKLLRFLETGEFMPVGASSAVKVDARVISATNRDLYAEVQAGRFRQDLFYRLNVVPLQMPPLRQRLEDVEILLTQFTHSFATESRLAPPSYTKEALDTLRSYNWPGNVRELKNFCHRMTILLSGCLITVDNLPAEIKGTRHAMREGFSLLDMGLGLNEMEEELIRQALLRADGNRSKAARALGVSRDTLLYRLKKHQLG